jgi:hypothetical protein
MNLFFLDADPEACARYLCDRHVGKVGIMEANQMLSSALFRHTGDESLSRGYAHHPMTLWVGDSRANFLFTARHALFAAKEWIHRYGRPHGSSARTPGYLERAEEIPAGPMTNPPLCMPSIYQIGGAVKSYRAYYRGAKADIARWTARPVPHFMCRS